MNIRALDGARRVRSLGVALTVALGCRPGEAGVATERSVPRLVTPVPCLPEIPGARYHCGRLIVPESRDLGGRPAGQRLVTVEFVVFAANREPRQPDPIVVLSDAAGVSAFVGLLRLKQYQAEGTDRDLIVLEQRGAGYSTPALHCAAPVDSVATGLRTCRDSLAQSGVDLEQYHPAAVAADLRDLLRLLDVRQANVYGPGFGSRIALSFAALAPELVRTVILDGPDGIDPSGTSPATKQLAALARVARQCHADPACRARHPNPLASFNETMTRLEASPAGATTVSADEFFGMVVGALSDQAKLAGMPAGLAMAAEGDWIAAARLLQRGADIPEGVAMHRINALGAQLAFGCADTAPASAISTGDRWPAAVLRVAEARDRVTAERCRAWRSDRPVTPMPGPTIPTEPTLILAGENDPTISLESVREFGARLPKATVVVSPSTSRGSLAHRCPREVIRSFLAAPDRPVETGCIATMPSIQFTLP